MIQLPAISNEAQYITRLYFIQYNIYKSLYIYRVEAYVITE